MSQPQGDIAMGEARAKARATRSRSDCCKASMPLGFLLAALSSRKPLTALLPLCRLVTYHGAARGHEASALCGDASTPLHSTSRGGAEAGWRWVGEGRTQRGDASRLGPVVPAHVSRSHTGMGRAPLPSSALHVWHDHCIPPARPPTRASPLRPWLLARTLRWK